MADTTSLFDPINTPIPALCDQLPPDYNPPGTSQAAAATSSEEDGSFLKWFNSVSEVVSALMFAVPEIGIVASAAVTGFKEVVDNFSGGNDQPMSAMMNTLLAQITDLDRLTSINQNTSQVSTVYHNIKNDLAASQVGDAPIPSDLADPSSGSMSTEHRSLSAAFENLRNQVKGYKGDLVDAIGNIEGFLAPGTNDIATRAGALPAYIGSAQVHITLYQIYMAFLVTQNTSVADRTAEMRGYIIKLKQYTYWATSTMNDICAAIDNRLDQISPVSNCVNIGPAYAFAAFGVTFWDDNESKVNGWYSPINPEQDGQSRTVGIDQDLWNWTIGEDPDPRIPGAPADNYMADRVNINDTFIIVRYLTNNVWGNWWFDTKTQSDVDYYTVNPTANAHIQVDRDSYVKAATQEQQVTYHFTMCTSFKNNHIDLWMHTMQQYNQNLPDSSKVAGVPTVSPAVTPN